MSNSSIIHFVLLLIYFRSRILTALRLLNFPHLSAFPVLIGCFFGEPILSEFYMFGGTAVPFGTRASNSVNVLKRVNDETFVWKQLKAIGDVPVRQYGSASISYQL